jgi:hypothetical protein
LNELAGLWIGWLRCVRKLAVHNFLRNRKVSVGEIRDQLLTNTRFRQVESFTKAQVGMTLNGKYAMRLGPGSGYISRITAHHELLHMSQYIADAGLNAATRSWSGKLGGGLGGQGYALLRRLPYEIVPSAIGSAGFHGPALVGIGGVALGGYEISGWIFR